MSMLELCDVTTSLRRTIVKIGLDLGTLLAAITESAPASISDQQQISIQSKNDVIRVPNVKSTSHVHPIAVCSLPCFDENNKHKENCLKAKKYAPGMVSSEDCLF